MINAGCGRESVDVLIILIDPSVKLSLLLRPFFSKYPSAHLQHRLKSFSAPFSILAESLDARLFDLGSDLLPPSTHRGDLGILRELRSFMPG